jgi:hypothetical protein
LDEVEAIYATNDHRRRLFEGFKRGFASLQHAGCQTIFLDGSFTGENPNPEDFDACWVPMGVDPRKLDPVLLDFSKKREAQKRKYGGEFFPSTAYAQAGMFFFNYFQRDKYTGKPKGIIRVHWLVRTNMERGDL